MVKVRQSRTSSFAPLACFGLSLLFLIIGLMGLSDAFAFRRTAARADGVVYETVHGGSHPMIRFDLPSGEAITYPQNGLIGGYRVGDRVQVLYDPLNPRSSACVNTLGGILGGLSFVFSACALTFVGGLHCMFVNWLRPRLPR